MGRLRADADFDPVFGRGPARMFVNVCSIVTVLGMAGCRVVVVVHHDPLAGRFMLKPKQNGRETTSSSTCGIHFICYGSHLNI